MNFTFNNKSSLDILPGVELYICNINDEYSSTVPLFSRELISTEFSQQQDYRRITGSKYSDGFSFNFSIIKNPCQTENNEFSFEEINVIANWLYGTATSQKLEICSEELGDKQYYYVGIFKNIEKIRFNGTIGLKCVFETNSPYLYEKCGGFPLPFTAGQSITETINVKCQNLIYPKIKIYNISGVSDDNKIFNIQVDNIQDDGRHFEYSTRLILNPDMNNKSITIDNENSIINNDDIILDFSSIGWNSVNDIQWLKFRNGTNTLKFTGNISATVKIEWQNKILGGVLNEFSV